MTNTYSISSDITLVQEFSNTQIVRVLQQQGIKTLGGLEEIDCKSVFIALNSEENDVFYDVMHRANIAFRLAADTEIDQLPNISTTAKSKLKDAGYKDLKDFTDVYYPSIYDLVGFGVGKSLLIFIVSSSTQVAFKKPNWNENDWHSFVSKLVTDGLVTWEDVAVCVTSELNPPQVGTAVANNVKHNYPPRKTMKEVFKWFYEQDGKCSVSGKRLWLEVDHIEPKEVFIKRGDHPKEADTLANFQLLTKRENVVKRGSHRLGGLSFAPASSALMYILLRFKPTSLAKFSALCREHGLTMASIRFSEAWAMAEWLNKVDQYAIDRDSE